MASNCNSRQSDGTESTDAAYGVATSSNTVTVPSGGNDKNSKISSQKRKKRTLHKLRRKVSFFSTGFSLKKVKYLQNLINKYKDSSLGNLLYNAEMLLWDEVFQKVLKNITKKEHLYLHMKLIVANEATEKHYSMNEKLDALAFFKKDPRCYKFLCKYVPLPSLKIINQLLSQVKITSGINPIIFKKLEQRILLQKECSLSFGEMCLTPHVSYDQCADKLHGFATNDNVSIAKHAIVFMIKGAGHEIKLEQPLAYYFTSKLTKPDLKTLIRNVVEHAVEIGFKIVSLICNDSPLNVAVINELINETKNKYLRRGMDWRYDMIRIKCQIMIPLFNISKIFMDIRNQLITNDLVYTVENKQKTIKWKYFHMLNNVQWPNDTCRILKLKEEHFNPKKIYKKDPTLAIELFSQNVAGITHFFVKYGKLPQECHDLIDLTLVLAQLYDTFTGDPTEIDPNDKYKGPVTVRSPHQTFWKKARTILSTIKFLKRHKEGDKIRLTEITVPSVSNLIKTIESMESLCRVMYGRYGFNVLFTSNFNYSSLDTLIGNITRHGVRNNPPNAMEFERAFKASLIDTRIHFGLMMDCDEDDIIYFQTLNFFFKKTYIPAIDEETDINFDCEKLNSCDPNSDDQSKIICRWILERYLHKVAKGCQSCIKTLLNNGEHENNSREDNKCKKRKLLFSPSKCVVNFFKDIKNQATALLRGVVPKTKLKYKIKDIIDISTDTEELCETHKNNFIKYFKNTALNIIIYCWCTSINRIMIGKNVYIGDNVTRLEALNFFKQNMIKE